MLVETYGGNTILPHDAWVWTRVGDETARKLVKHLQPNDLVLEQRPDVKVSLAQIKRALLEDDLAYRSAHEQLHLPSLVDGKPVPRLQQYLLDSLGMTHKDLKNLETVAAGVERITARLERLDARANAIFGDRKTIRLERSGQAVTEWLTGTTVLPSRPQVLRVLRRLSPKRFDNLFGKPQELKLKGAPDRGNALLFAHDFWRKNHAALRNWVSGFSKEALDSEKAEFKVPKAPQEEAEKNAGSSRKREGTSLADQRRLVYEKLIKPIFDPLSPRYAFVRVKRTRPVDAPSPPREKPFKGEAPSLPRGVVAARDVTPARFGARETNYGAIHRKGVYLGRIAQNALDAISVRLPNGSERTGCGMAVSSAVASREQILKVEQDALVGLPHVERGVRGTRLIRLKKSDVLELGGTALEQLSSGKLDEKFGLTPGTLLDVFNRSTLLISRVPVYPEITRLHQETTAFATEANAWMRARAPTSDAQALKDFQAKFGARKAELTHRADVLRAYGISPFSSLLVPEDFGVTDVKGLEEVRAQISASNAFGVDLSPIPAPASEPELTGLLQELHLPDGDVQKLLDLFGRHNFITSPEGARNPSLQPGREPFQHVARGLRQRLRGR